MYSENGNLTCQKKGCDLKSDLSIAASDPTSIGLKQDEK